MTLILPLMMVSVIGLVLTIPLKKLRPRSALLISSLTLVLGALASVPVLLHVTMQGVVAIPQVGSRVHHYLHADGVHLMASDPAGYVFVGLSLVALWRIVRVLGVRRQLSSTHPGGTLVLPDQRLFAYTVPGPDPAIIVSQGLIDALSPAELEVVLLHEQAHIDERHDRWKLLGLCCAMINPLLIPMRQQLDFALERVADDSAALACGSRRLVATTIAKLALHTDVPATSLGIAATSVAMRIESLAKENDQDSTTPRNYALLGASVIAVLCALQWHHIAQAITSMCGL